MACGTRGHLSSVGGKGPLDPAEHNGVPCDVMEQARRGRGQGQDHTRRSATRRFTLLGVPRVQSGRVYPLVALSQATVDGLERAKLSWRANQLDPLGISFFACVFYSSSDEDDKQYAPCGSVLGQLLTA